MEEVDNAIRMDYSSGDDMISDSDVDYNEQHLGNGVGSESDEKHRSDTTGTR